MYVYADNAATTAMSETALEAMLPCLREEYANPSSLHTPGQRAAEKLTEAREIFAGTDTERFLYRNIEPCLL